MSAQATTPPTSPAAPEPAVPNIPDPAISTVPKVPETAVRRAPVSQVAPVARPKASPDMRPLKVWLKQLVFLLAILAFAISAVAAVNAGRPWLKVVVWSAVASLLTAMAGTILSLIILALAEHPETSDSGNRGGEA
jgi:hypothetical protein